MNSTKIYNPGCIALERYKGIQINFITSKTAPAHNLSGELPNDHRFRILKFGGNIQPSAQSPFQKKNLVKDFQKLWKLNKVKQFVQFIMSCAPPINLLQVSKFVISFKFSTTICFSSPRSSLLNQQLNDKSRENQYPHLSFKNYQL